MKKTKSTDIKSKDIQLVEIHKLVSNPKNNNQHPKEQIDRLVKLIDYQGFRNPVVVSNRTGFLVAGHGRIEAAKKLGWEKVPVMYQDFKDDAEEYSYMTSDNAIASWANLDLSMVNTEMLDLGPDFNIDLLGIKDFVIEPVEKFDPLSDEDAVPEVEHPITRRGDVWLLSTHRLMCGDSTMIDDVEKLMNGEKADMVFTDPPYNTGMTAKHGSTWLSHMFNDSFTDKEWQDLLSGFTANAYAFLKDNSAAYFCLDWRRNHELQEHLRNSFKISNVIVWDKVVHGLGSDYKYTYELINVCKKGKPELDTHQGDREYSDVWHIQRKMGKDKDHATKKPIEIIERCLRHATKPNSSCLDLFGGSGSTLIACEKNNRKSFLMELSELYVDTTVKRWEEYTGKKATLELTNQTYDELKEERDGKTT
jgi:DNA modification methylase